MGAWGGGLYDGDFARDMRATIDGLWKAPISDDDILAEIEQAHGLGHDGEHVDGFDYWLVLAEQLERRGMPRKEVFDHAIAIMDTAADIAALEALGAKAKTLNKRRKEHDKLLERLRSPRPARQRRPLTTPQPLLFQLGEAIIWPTDKGQFKAPWVAGGFKQDGWGFGLISDVGHVYGVLAFHALQALKWRRADRPTAAMAQHCARSEHHYGRVTPEFAREIGIESIGAAPGSAMGPPLDPNQVDADPRKAALLMPDPPHAFGWDAFNHAVWPGPKFMFKAPAGDLPDSDDPDQRTGMFEDDGEFGPLSPDQPATRAHYFAVMRAQMTESG